jgi:hypothetical protein
LQELATEAEVMATNPRAATYRAFLELGEARAEEGVALAHRQLRENLA